MAGKPDVVVVGGGAIGVCVAYELASQGASVTLLERGPELAWGCSAGNAGLICPSHAAPLATPAALKQGLRWLGKPDSPFYLKPRPAVLPWIARFVAASTPGRAHRSSLVIRQLSRASLARHEELAGAGLPTGFQRRGSLNVLETEEAFAAAQAEAREARQAGLDVEVLPGSAGAELAPGLIRQIAGCVLYPGDAHCDPAAFVHAVGGAAAEAGVALRTRVEVIGLTRANGRISRVLTTEGEIEAGEVVLAAGAWSARLARDVGLSLPVEGGKGYHVDLEGAAGDPPLPVWFQESRVILTPLAGRLRIAGTLELSGLDLSVDQRRVRAIVAAAERGMAGLEDRRRLEVWRGLRPCSPDGLPIVGRPEGLENLVVATGHGMMGLTLAPITGRMVADIVAGRPSDMPVEALRPDRFRLPLLSR